MSSKGEGSPRGIRRGIYIAAKNEYGTRPKSVRNRGEMQGARGEGSAEKGIFKLLHPSCTLYSN